MSEEIKEYFPHEYGAGGSKKMLCVKAELKLLGFKASTVSGTYWELVELMYDEPNTKLSLDYLIGYADKLGLNLEEITTFVEIAIKYKLFNSADGFFWSDFVFEQKEFRESKKKKNSETNARAGRLAMANRYGYEVDEDGYKINETLQQTPTETSGILTKSNGGLTETNNLQQNLTKVKVKEKEEKKEIPKGISKEKEIFEEFRLEYKKLTLPGRVRKLDAEFDNFQRKCKDWRNKVFQLLPALKIYAVEWERKGEPQFVPALTVWINQKKYEIEIEPSILPVEFDGSKKVAILSQPLETLKLMQERAALEAMYAKSN